MAVYQYLYILECLIYYYELCTYIMRKIKILPIRILQNFHKYEYIILMYYMFILYYIRNGITSKFLIAYFIIKP